MELAAPLNDSAPKTFTRDFAPALLSNYLPAALFSVLLIMKIKGFFYLLNTGNSGVEFYLSLVMRSSIVVFTAMVVFLCVVRHRPVKKAKGLWPRFTAFCGTFLIFFLLAPEAKEASLLQSGIASALSLAGIILSITALIMLGKSFSMMAEARRLVTTGFYSFVRHPLYLAEEILLLGVIIQMLSPFNVAVFILQTMFQIQRLKNEEAVLQESFPEYEEYKSRTAMLIPGIY